MKTFAQEWGLLGLGPLTVGRAGAPVGPFGFADDAGAAAEVEAPVETTEEPVEEPVEDVETEDRMQIETNEWLKERGIDPLPDDESPDDESSEETEAEETEADESEESEAEPYSAEEIEAFRAAKPALEEYTRLVERARDGKEAAVREFCRTIGAPDPYPQATTGAPEPLDRNAELLSALNRRGYEVTDVSEIDALVADGTIDAVDLETAQAVAATKYRDRLDEIAEFNQKSNKATEAQQRQFVEIMQQAERTVDSAIKADPVLKNLTGDDATVLGEILNILALNAHYSGEPMDKASKKRVEQFASILRNAQTATAMKVKANATRKANPGAAGTPSKKPGIQLEAAVPHSNRGRDKARQFLAYYDRHGHMPGEE